MKPFGQVAGFVQLLLENELAELARSAAGQADDAFLEPGQQLLVDARHVVVAFEKGDGSHLDEVLKAGEVPREEGEVIAGLAAPPRFALAALAGRHISLVTDDRIDAGRGAFFVKLDGPVEVAVVRQGQGVHALLLGPGHQFGNAAGPVEQAVMAMAMQMHEGLC